GCRIAADSCVHDPIGIARCVQRPLEVRGIRLIRWHTEAGRQAVAEGYDAGAVGGDSLFRSARWCCHIGFRRWSHVLVRGARRRGRRGGRTAEVIAKEEEEGEAEAGK